MIAQVRLRADRPPRRSRDARDALRRTDAELERERLERARELDDRRVPLGSALLEAAGHDLLEPGRHVLAERAHRPRLVAEHHRAELGD